MRPAPRLDAPAHMSATGKNAIFDIITAIGYASWLGSGKAEVAGTELNSREVPRTGQLSSNPAR